MTNTDVFVLTGVEVDFLVLLLGPDVEEQALTTNSGASLWR